MTVAPSLERDGVIIEDRSGLLKKELDGVFRDALELERVTVEGSELLGDPVVEI